MTHAPASQQPVVESALHPGLQGMKYSGDSRDIALRLLRRDGDVSIEVSDAGIGIPEQEHERIFEKYYRVQSAETARIPGAGLGLTLVRHAVAAHGGRLLVSSALGRGSTFSMCELPLMPVLGRST